MTRTPRILTLIGDMDGCALWRCLNPITELQRQGYPSIEWGQKDDDRLALIAHKFDAVILPRLHWPADEREKARKWFTALRRAGLKIFYELDDDLLSDHFVRRLVVSHGQGEDFASERRNSILHTIRQCDGATVSSQRLATLLRQHVDLPIEVVPNYIDWLWFARIQRENARTVPPLTIGWAGGARPDDDVRDMAVAWARIAKRFPDVKFVVQGHQAKVIYDLVPNERITPLDWMPIQAYPAGLMNIDIGCCPLSDNPFNRCKTPIKAMEYAAVGAAVVASPTLYSKIVQHGSNGYIASNPDEWEWALADLVENKERRRQLTKQLRSDVKREHSLQKNAWRWLVAWDNLLQAARQQVQKPVILIPFGVDLKERSHGIQSTYQN